MPPYGVQRAAICRSPAKRPSNIVDVSLNKRYLSIVHAGFNLYGYLYGIDPS